MKPIDVPTRETTAFIRSHAAPETTILEIGCGEGDVASALLNEGYNVIAVDSDPQTIQRVQARGVPALCAIWPELEFDAADTIVFTRSLHHITPLSTAIQKAQKILRRQGHLLIEDFSYSEASAETIDWFLDAVRSADEKGLIRPRPGEFITAIAAAENPLNTWQRSHDHDLHTISAMTQAIAKHFVVENTCAVPYLYRYLEPLLPDTTPAAEFLRGILEQEAQLGAKGDIVLIGRRIVASSCDAR